MLISDYKFIGAATFPPYAGRQFYMHSRPAGEHTMPEGLEDYIPVVARLLKAADVPAEREVHITVDEKVVAAGMSQRRPGPHVDGYFRKAEMRWGGPGPGPTWLHHCNELPVSRMAVIVAATVPGCTVWRGRFDAEPGEGGDMSHISDQLKDGAILLPNRGYLLTPDCVHESMIFEKATERQFLRIAFVS